MWIGRPDRGTTHPSNLRVNNTAAHCIPSFGDSRRTTAGQLTTSPDKNCRSTCVLFSNAHINTFNEKVMTNWCLRICSQNFGLFHQNKKHIHNDKCTWTSRHSENNFNYSHLYTGCNRRNGPNFGRVFLMLNYTDITQNTYVQSWTIIEIMAK